MNPTQKDILFKFLEKYFSGGNERSENGVMLKTKLEAIRDFVKENF